MPALVTDIAAGTREASILTWTNAGVVARYPSARDGSVEPSDGYCDNAADTQALVEQRGALIGAERRRFAVTADDLLWPDLSAFPSARLVDDEQAVNAALLVARLEIDLEAGTTSLELFG